MTRQNYSTLQAKINKEIEKLQKQAQALQSKQRKPAIASIVRSMKENDISPEEIAAAFGKSKTKAGGGVKATKSAKTARVKKPGPVAEKHHYGSSRPKKMAKCASSF
jgi:DNA-binding protein H-NS